MPTPIKAPDTLAELLANPQRVKDAFTLLNGLANLRVQIVVADANSALAQSKPTLRGEGPDNIVLNLPLKSPTAVADSTATAASVSTHLNQLLAILRTGKFPGGS